MSDRIELPNNAENFYQKAIAFLQRQRYEEAIDALKKSLRITFSVTAFDELVKLFLFLKQYEQLGQFWQEYFPNKNDRFQDEMVRFLYAISVPYLYSLDHAIIELYQLRDYTQEHNQATEPYIQLLNEWKKTKEIRDVIAQTPSEDKFKQLTQTMSQDGPLGYLVQLKKIYDLPIEESEGLLRHLLKEVGLENFVKNDILHYLLNIGYKGDLAHNWFGAESMLSMSELQAYYQQNFYKETLKAIQDYSQQKNPHLETEIIQHFNLHAMIYYPYMDQIFATPKDWLVLFLQQNQMDNLLVMPESELAEFYFQKAVDELEKILTI